MRALKRDYGVKLHARHRTEDAKPVKRHHAGDELNFSTTDHVT